MQTIVQAVRVNTQHNTHTHTPGRIYEWGSQRYRLIMDKHQTSRFPVEVLLPTELLQEYRRNATLGLDVVC
eukprot:625611-Pelagomonas_calceolata.AAC.2